MPHTFAPHVPYYYQIKEDIKQKVLNGALRPDEQLANEIELARQYGVSRATLRQATQALVQEGFLRSVRGKGTFVRGPVLYDDAETFTVFPDAVEESQMWEAGAAVTLIPVPPEMAAELDVPWSTQVYRIVLRHRSHGRPVAVRTLHVPEPLVPDSAQWLRSRGSSALLTEARLEPERAVQRFQAVACDAADGKLLGVPEGAAVMVWQGVLYGAEGTRIAHVRTVFLGDAYVFVIHQGRAGKGDAAPVLRTEPL